MMAKALSRDRGRLAHSACLALAPGVSIVPRPENADHRIPSIQDAEVREVWRACAETLTSGRLFLDRHPRRRWGAVVASGGLVSQGADGCRSGQSCRRTARKERRCQRRLPEAASVARFIMPWPMRSVTP